MVNYWPVVNSLLFVSLLSGFESFTATVKNFKCDFFYKIAKHTQCLP